jgi:hypothetical protein
MNSPLKLALLTLFVCLTCSRAEAQSNATSLYQLLFRGLPTPKISSITITRVEPRGETEVAITASRIMRSYSAEATIKFPLDPAFKTLLYVFQETDASSPEGCTHVVQEPDALPVGWGIRAVDDAGTEVAFIALTQDGECAVIHGKLHQIGRNLVTFLSRYFSFLNYGQ